jgi:demethylmenaquinone methyltransferase/2-methoxy-6-polyprenyl-1,4-benzoquinol methylase
MAPQRITTCRSPFPDASAILGQVMSRTSTPADLPDGAPARHAPHPVLSRYYRRPDERPSFLVELFDGAAGYYEQLCGIGSLGSGAWYRGGVLRRAGLRRGMKVLDVATGTGLVARAAASVVRDPRAVLGLDPSGGMLRQAQRTFSGPLVQGRIEELPARDATFDFVTVGYALRHAADLDVAFRECLRVLAPGGRLVVLEISRPRSRAMQAAARFYLTRVLPFIMRTAHARLLMEYYWATIDTCVPAGTIVDLLRRAGFIDVRHIVRGGVQNEYLATRPR